MKTIILFAFSTATLLAADQPSALTVTEQTAFTFYQPFKRLTSSPHLVAPLTSFLCASPSPDQIQHEKDATGPHYHARIHIYTNPAGDDAISRHLETFPTGAVIVKEKLAKDGSVNAVGGMIKRDAGFDSEHGDWDYFFAAKTGGFSSGLLQNCIECHANPKARDHVFSVWRPFR